MVPNSNDNFSSRSNWKESEKDLVAEQSGMGLSLIGLFLALFSGLAIRSLVSPEKVRAQLEKAIQSIHQEAQFQFRGAHVSFANGIWPDLAVVVQDVVIESKQPCFYTPLAEINEIRLPLSWWHLLKGQIFIHEVLVDEMNLSLRSELGTCDPKRSSVSSEVSEMASQSSPAEQVADSVVAPVPVPPPVPAPVPSKADVRFENVPRKNPIDTLRFQTVKVHYLPVAFTSFEIQKLLIKLKSEDPRRIEATGHLSLGGETLVGDYSSQADLKVEMVEGDQPSLMSSVKGIWREGHYNLKLGVDLQRHEFDLTSAVHHLPISQVIPLLRKYRLMESDFNGKRAWISGEMKMKGVLSKIRQTPIQFDKLKLEGDLGEIASPHIQVESLQPFKMKPVELSIKGLNVKELLTFLNRPHPSPTLGELGVFNGNAHFVNPENVSLRGDYSGLEFIFSNRGSRKAQALSLVSGELFLEKKRWRISLDRVRPAGGIFEGKVQITADKDFRDLDVDAKIDELSFAPEVQQLMTSGGSLGALMGHLKIRVHQAEIRDLWGNIRWDQLSVEGVHLTKPRVQVQTYGAETWIDFSALDLDLSTKNPTIAALFSPLMEELQIKKDERFLLKNPRGHIRTQKLKQLVWSDFRAQANRDLFQSQGGWNEASEIFGEFKVSGTQRSQWILGGNRNSPSLRKKERVQ